jgi:hypothetical protein
MGCAGWPGMVRITGDCVTGCVSGVSAIAPMPAQVTVPAMIQADADSFANHCGRCSRSSAIKVFMLVLPFATEARSLGGGSIDHGNDSGMTEG